MKYLTVPQVAEELKFSYQKVLYMIRVGKLPAEKDGRAYNIPANYREVMVEGRRKRFSKRIVAKNRREKQKEGLGKGAAGNSFLVENLVKAIHDIVMLEVRKAMR